MTEPEGILVIKLTDADLEGVEYKPREEMIDPALFGNAIMTPYGICSPGFDSHDPPWRRRQSDF